MVKLQHQASIPTSAPKFWAALKDPAYYAHPDRAYLGKMTRTEHPDGRVDTYIEPPPSPLLAKIPGADKRTDYTHTERRDEDKRVIDWRVQVHNSLIANRTKISGTVKIDDNGDGTCRRTINTEINIPFPFSVVLNPIISADMKSGFEKDDAFARKFDWAHYEPRDR